MLHWFHGPLLAIVFPVTNTLELPFEWQTYWWQHLLLVLVPFYMIFCTNVYSVHAPFSGSWILMSYGIWGIYHWIVLHGVGVLTLANTGSILCPAISDPFVGPNYRLHATWHQFVMTALFGTLCALIAKASEAVYQYAYTETEAYSKRNGDHKLD